MLLRTDLRIKIEQIVKKSGLIQSEAAEMLGITQPRLNDLLIGRIEKFSLDALWPHRNTFWKLLRFEVLPE